ncbi:MAG TPA: OB-fold domain-containing protein [Acidimicrobiia bacterium]|nr:OB-fold domain-containing protein [Acidimicrobiia bacterium]
MLVESHVLEYPGGYTRSVGPIVGRFLTGLRDAEIVGARASDGRVIVPPLEYDPTTAEPIGEFVDVGPGGAVTAWTWVAEPRPTKSPLDDPFAFALVLLDGADTPMLHAVDVDGPDAMSVGMRVGPRWRAERVGSIRDIAAFVPEGSAGPTPESPAPTTEEREPVTGIVSPVRLEYEINAGVAQTKYLRGLAEGKVIGQRAKDSDQVYVPPRGTDPTTGVLTEIDVEVADSGTVTTFCVVNVPGLSELAPEIPYVCAQILLDGGNTPWFGLVQGIEADDVHMGMRVKAVWADELEASAASIKWFEPTGEADAPYESYREYA